MFRCVLVTSPPMESRLRGGAFDSANMAARDAAVHPAELDHLLLILYYFLCWTASTSYKQHPLHFYISLVAYRNQFFNSTYIFTYDLWCMHFLTINHSLTSVAEFSSAHKIKCNVYFLKCLLL